MIWRGAGNMPVCGLHMRSITACDSLPCSSSTSVAMEPVQSCTSACHCALGSAVMSITIWYSSEPVTLAVILPGWICRSTTEPLRT